MRRSDFVRVSAGDFIYGPEITYERLAKAPPPRPRQKMWLNEFWVARTPVTYSHWKAFEDDTGYRRPGHWWAIRRGPRGWLRRFGLCASYPPEMAGYPMVDVTLADARAWCAWMSARLGAIVSLPTEFQWEKAARGADGRSYPWGEDLPRPDQSHLQPTHRLGLDYFWHNLRHPRPGCELARSGWYWRTGAPWPVGSAPRNISPCGALDMAGNIWEWTTSRYHPDEPHFHVVKGGSWGYSPAHTAANCRSACSITIPSVEYHAQGTGFRPVINDE